MADPLLKIEDVARELSVHPETVRVWIRKRELKAVALNRTYRIRRSDLDEFLREHETLADDQSQPPEGDVDSKTPNGGQER